MSIRNTEGLLSHGNVYGRRIVLSIIEAGLKAADPYINTRKLIRVEGKKLVIGREEFDVTKKGVETLDLSKIGNIYVIGAGKAAQRIAKAIEDTLGDRITCGAINAKKGEGKYLKKIEVTEAGHPIPDEESVIGTKKIVEIAKLAKEDDLFLCIISGGISALLTLPAPGISLEDKIEVTRIMQQVHGVPTSDLNVVRGNLSAVKDGRLATLIHPAKIIVVMLWGGMSNVSYDRIMKQGGTYPFLPGSKTYNDAVTVIHKWNLWDEMPKSVRTFLKKANPRYAIPGKEAFKNINFGVFQVMNSSYMVAGAKERTKELGFKPIVLPMVGSTTEASELAKALSEIAIEVEVYGEPFKPPCVLITNGESIVTVGEGAKTAKGGRNQEFAVSSALKIRGSKVITIAAVDSDGTDGPTDVAGGVVDGYTADIAEIRGVDLFKAMKNHNTTDSLMKLDDAVITGCTGTNTQDLRVIFIDKVEKIGK